MLVAASAIAVAIGLERDVATSGNAVLVAASAIAVAIGFGRDVATSGNAV